MPAAAALRIAHVGFFNDPARRPPHQLLAAWPSMVDVAEAARAGGAEVSVVQSSPHTERHTHNGVDYHFLPFGSGAGLGCEALAARLSALAVQLVHVHGLLFCRDVLALARLRPALPLVLQDHASRVPRPWHRPHWRRALASADALLFCARAQAEPFVAVGALPRSTPVYAVPESSSRFTPGARAEARRLTGLCGEPAVLWVGHLDRNKDPLTLLAGISAATRTLPDLRLWCCFGSAPLLKQAEAFIRADARLTGRVRLLGAVPHAQIELLMRAADLFVLASHREGSGYALIEALACGLPPVVTDIPSFRALTGGRVGALWPCDQPAACAAALCGAAMADGAVARAAVRAHFERELSFAALGEKLVAVYRQVIARRQRALVPAVGHRA
jgi:glycosyltransferase involved in cell wall biosynthesis